MIKLVVFDLDNVIIDGEAIDEIGKLINVEKEIAEITDKAMNGEIDFKTAIIDRVKLLKGIPLEDVEKVANELPLMKGSEETIKALKDDDYQVAVISGSFDVVGNIIKDKLGFDYLFANEFKIEDEKLNGEVTGPLVSGTKLDLLNEFISDKDISLDEIIAIGDGANDISIIEAVGCGIAFNAKPPLKEVADIVIDEKDLSKILDVIDDGESTEEEVEDADSEIIDKTEDIVKEPESKEAKDGSKSKKSKKDKLPESTFVLADTMDGVREQKDEREATIAKIADEREDFNKIAKEQRKIRDELNASLKENLSKAIEFRNERNKINKEVENAKKLRNEVNNKIKNLEWSSGKRDKIKIENEIKKIDKIIETRVLDIKKENQLVKNANDLRKQLMEIHEDESIKEEQEELKKESEIHHAKVVELSEKAQTAHEEMLVFFRKTDDIRTAADEAHKKFIEARKNASNKHEEFKVVLSDIHLINKKLGNKKSKRRKSDKQSSGSNKNREEKEKAENIFDKFKKGKKLSTEELLLLQKYNIG